MSGLLRKENRPNGSGQFPRYLVTRFSGFPWFRPGRELGANQGRVAAVIGNVESQTLPSLTRCGRSLADWT